MTIERHLSAAVRRAIPALLIALLTVGIGCADSLAPDTTVNRVTLTPVTATVGIGLTQQLTATARNRRSDPLPDVPIIFTSEQPAVATVSASGLVTGVSTGVATLRATAGTFSATATITVAVPVCQTSLVTNTITTTQSINGALTANDCLYSTFGSADGYRFVATGPTTVLFTLTGDSIVPNLVLTGTSVATIIDGSLGADRGDTTRLLVSVAAGTYHLWAYSEPNRRGTYTLTSRPAVACTFNDALPALAIGQTFAGAIGASSCLLPNGSEAAGRSISITADTEVRYDVKANGFQPVIFITNRSLEIFSISLAATPDSSVLQDILPAGDYHVWVSSTNGGQGSFSLTRSTAVFNYCSAPIATISVPGSFTGALAFGDCVVEPGFLSDPILMVLSAPTRVRIDLTSTQFDTFLLVADSTNTLILGDDDGAGGGSTNSRLIVDFPAGRFTLLPTSYEPNTTGTYNLSVSILAGINGGPSGSGGNIRLTPKPRARTRSWDELAGVPPTR